jgi:C4-dicarboxylate-specific signal transduction histidine kinase
MIASISHEINQPLGSILTNAETAREILTSPAPDIVELNSIADDIIQMIDAPAKSCEGMRSL